jgi:biopolymer transport protein TolQ
MGLPAGSNVAGDTVIVIATNSFVGAFLTSNWAGKSIVVLLVVFSILAWAVMVTKHREIEGAVRATRRFLNAFRRESHPLTLFLRRQPMPASPLLKIYEAGCAALGAEADHGAAATGQTPSLQFDGLTAPRFRVTSTQVEVVRRATERTMDDEILVLEDRMGFLMTAISVSPLLGLLGTVWGVMEAFWGMAHGGIGNISAVAPGISGALLTTVIGLLVAIPSTFGYNLLAGRIRRLTVQMDNFAQELVAALQREYSRDAER